MLKIRTKGLRIVSHPASSLTCLPPEITNTLKIMRRLLCRPVPTPPQKSHNAPENQKYNAFRLQLFKSAYCSNHTKERKCNLLFGLTLRERSRINHQENVFSVPKMSLMSKRSDLLGVVVGLQLWLSQAC